MGGAWIKGLPAEKEQTKTGPGDCIAVLCHLSRLGSISGQNQRYKGQEISSREGGRQGQAGCGRLEGRTRVPAEEWTHKESRSKSSYGAKHMRWDLGKAVALFTLSTPAYLLPTCQIPRHMASRDHCPCWWGQSFHLDKDLLESQRQLDLQNGGRACN